MKRRHRKPSAELRYGGGIEAALRTSGMINMSNLKMIPLSLSKATKPDQQTDAIHTT
jgi:hypothetical protein